MKVYTLVDYKDNHPLYVCLSKKIAEELQHKLDISCYIQEIPFITQQPSLMTEKCS